MANNSPYLHSNGSSQEHLDDHHENAPPNSCDILHLGDPIEYNHDLFNRLESQFKITCPPLSELTRANFIKHLQDKTWGNFSAIMRPFWNTGGEMGDWDRELIELLPPNMKIMASAGAGFDWVDVVCLGEHGILYANGAGASTESVADMAIYYIVSTFRHLNLSSIAARSLNPTFYLKAHTQIPAISHNPRDQILGIVGLGNIGLAIARKAKAAFGMCIHYHDVQRKDGTIEDELDATWHPKLPSLLSTSHAILLATPGGKPILTASTLALLPQGARVINIGRGTLIDEDALADAIESGHISAAGLDVHRDEPRVNHRLARLENVSMTSHTGGGTVETMMGFEKLVLENVEGVLREGWSGAKTGVNWTSLKKKDDGEKPVANGHGCPDDGRGNSENEATTVAVNGHSHSPDLEGEEYPHQQQQQQQQQQQGQGQTNPNRHGNGTPMDRDGSLAS